MRWHANGFHLTHQNQEFKEKKLSSLGGVGGGMLARTLSSQASWAMPREKMVTQHCWMGSSLLVRRPGLPEPKTCFFHSVKWSFWFVFCISFCSLRMGMTYLISLKMMSSQELVSMPPPPRSQQRMTHDASLNLEMTTRGACWLSLPC